jgi:hypothetical protein
VSHQRACACAERSLGWMSTLLTCSSQNAFFTRSWSTSSFLSVSVSCSTRPSPPHRHRMQPHMRVPDQERGRTLSSFTASRSFNARALLFSSSACSAAVITAILVQNAGKSTGTGTGALELTGGSLVRRAQ